MQVVNVFICRGRRTSTASRPRLENPLLLSGIVAEIALVLAIDYTAVGNAVFGTAPIGYEAWLVVLPFAGAMLLTEKARKALWTESQVHVDARQEPRQVE